MTDTRAGGLPEPLDSTALLTGGVLGAAAYICTAALTSLYVVLDGVDPPAAFWDAATWKLVGWLVYGAHNVDIVVKTVPVQGGGQPSAESSDVFAELTPVTSLTSTVPEAVYLLTPVVVLVVAGAVVYRRVDGHHADPVAAATVGAAVTAGYLPLAVIGRFLVQYEDTVDIGIAVLDVWIAPKLVTTILNVGLVYPLVFGALGGVLASLSR